MRSIMHTHIKDEEKIVSELCDRYASQNGTISHVYYTGKSNHTLDGGFDEAEIWATLQKVKSKSALGPDDITNKVLRGLDNETISDLTKYINKCWT